MSKDKGKNTAAEPMTYEVRHVRPARQQFVAAIEREEETVELPAEKVQRVEITTTSPGKGGKKEA